VDLRRRRNWISPRAPPKTAYLVEHGVAKARLTSRGYGETQPIDKHRNEAAYRKNRRVDFVLRKRTED